jgi:hypothetical protein
VPVVRRTFGYRRDAIRYAAKYRAPKGRGKTGRRVEVGVSGMLDNRRR